MAKQLSVKEQITQFQKNAEANIVACLYKEPSLFVEHSGLEGQFNQNVWRVYYVIGRDMSIVEDKAVLDEISLGFYLEKHLQLKEKYIEYGGYNTIATLMKLARVENLDGYIEEFQKYNTISKLLDKNIIVTPELLKVFKDWKTEDIYAYYETLINGLFVNVDYSVSSFNLLDGLHELIESANAGENVGFPINSPLLNDKIGGNSLGNITLLAANSGVGKTTLTNMWILDNIIKYDEKVVVILNEQDEVKWKQEFMTHYINTKLNGNFLKKRWREGKFTEEEMGWLKKAADYLGSLKERKNITVIPLQTYKTNTVIKLIKKYKGLGVNYYILDTFKADVDTDSSLKWSQMADDMVKISDTIKKASKNVHIWVTLQLSKSAIKQRFLTQDNIGVAKNVIDTASTAILVRMILDTEKSGGKTALKVYRLAGANMKTKIPVELEHDKEYCVIFVDKNRFGSTKSTQIVAEIDLGRNVYKEIGITRVPEDF